MVEALQDALASLAEVESTLRSQVLPAVTLSETDPDLMKALRAQAERVFRARVRALKLQIHARQAETLTSDTDLPLPVLQRLRDETLLGGSDAILLEFGVPVRHLPDLVARRRERLIANARCLACDTPLIHFRHRDHDLDHDQLACTTCGGMYDLEVAIDSAR